MYCIACIRWMDILCFFQGSGIAFPACIFGFANRPVLLLGFCLARIRMGWAGIMGMDLGLGIGLGYHDTSGVHNASMSLSSPLALHTTHPLISSSLPAFLHSLLVLCLVVKSRGVHCISSVVVSSTLLVPAVILSMQRDGQHPGTPYRRVQFHLPVRDRHQLLRGFGQPLHDWHGWRDGGEYIGVRCGRRYAHQRRPGMRG
ncbi:uncharacterized protein K460DRAFT_87577 [Cucurbitaria berberidis CBS 394.84]|uniref:Uncharacterized protein n=1 Tax=Cucurbitaria berberidis CBS 394.84 TaxID=1168544 RepID=A0A9P4LC14_9PLEO|nr:uncharacterized protein K460DRAFT_87577 [Cucurbitaria berberidis CBS 394.84]KAF1849218.1 hypothetical protein K460DRAFT_87577 [Cucurbitaria berberidis CBS 394.84]